ncbi:flagellar protein FliO/FliZ [Bacillus capparidis]|nr:flagellar protein FliO/FliZ [Bacillus capparidis]
MVSYKSFMSISFIVCLLFAYHASPVSAAETGDATVDEWFQQQDEDKVKPVENRKEEKQSPPVKQPSASVSAMDFFRMIGALLFVIFLIYAVIKLLNKRNKMIRPFQYIENLGGTSLGQNRSVQLIKVGERVMVVGVGESIQLLKEIENEEERKVILAQHEETVNRKIELPKWLDQVKSSHKKVSEPKSSFADSLKKELKELKNLRKEGIKKGTHHNE